MSDLREYLKNPFLDSLYQQIKAAGPIRSVSLDITNTCNLRCKGCYYFEEGMDNFSAQNEEVLDLWIEKEKGRGTNFVTIVGGEPSQALQRLKKIYNNFRISVATNGLIRIPLEGFENLPIGIALWGDHKTDSILRANGKRDLFQEALKNYKDDKRAFWYYTVAPGNAVEIEKVVEECIQNGNRILFNYYSDLSNLGGNLDFRSGFVDVKNEIDRMIDLYPDKILTTKYLNHTVATGSLFDQKWGYEVCTNLSENFEGNKERLAKGMPSNPHFRAYNADFATTRRCCTGINRDCDSCYDTWEHFSWIMINMRKHLKSEEDFANWLTTVYTFYFVSRMVEPEDPDQLMKKIHMAAANEMARSIV